MKFDLLRSETVYTGRAFSVRRDHLKTPDGREVQFDIIGHVGSVIILPIDDSGNLHFVSQYRHAAGSMMLELPAGTLEPDEDPLDCARRETREETGMDPAELHAIGGFYLAPGYSTEYMHVFLARRLRHSPLAADVDEFLETRLIPVPDAYQMVRQGQMTDAKTVAALMLALPHLT